MAQREQNRVIKLQFPVQYGSQEIDELDVRRPKAKDLRKFPAQASNLSEMLDFAAYITGQTPSVIDLLELEDAMALFEVIQDFMPNSLKTGSKS